MSDMDHLVSLATSQLRRIAEALERIVYLMETEPIEVTIPNLHPSLTAPREGPVLPKEDVF